MANANDLVDALMGTSAQEAQDESAEADINLSTAAADILDLTRGRELTEDAVDASWRPKEPTKKQLQTIVTTLRNDYGVTDDEIAEKMRDFLNTEPDRGEVADLINSLFRRRQFARFAADRDA